MLAICRTCRPTTGRLSRNHAAGSTRGQLTAVTLNFSEFFPDANPSHAVNQQRPRAQKRNPKRGARAEGRPACVSSCSKGFRTMLDTDWERIKENAIILASRIPAIQFERPELGEKRGIFLRSSNDDKGTKGHKKKGRKAAHESQSRGHVTHTVAERQDHDNQQEHHLEATRLHPLMQSTGCQVAFIHASNWLGDMKLNSTIKRPPVKTSQAQGPKAPHFFRLG